MSQIHADPDLAVELFVLKPEEGGEEIVGKYEHDPGQSE